jgi:hypothetical protein
MNANKKHRQKTLLADKIEPFEFPFDTQAWESFEGLRDAKNQQKRAFRGQIGKYLGTFIALAGLCFWLFQDKMSQNNANLLSENNFNQKRDPSVYEANLIEKMALNDSELNKMGLFSSRIFSTVPEGRNIYNRRFQSAGTDLLRVPMSRRDNILTLKYSLYETKPIIGDMPPPIEIGSYKYFVSNGTVFPKNINNLDKNQFTNSFNNPLINFNKNELITANKNELIVKKTEKSDPSVSDNFLNVKTLLSDNLATIKNDNFNNATNEINADVLNKNIENLANVKAFVPNKISEMSDEISVTSANKGNFTPLSINPLFDAVLSDSSVFLPIIPSIKRNSLTKYPKNEAMFGNGISSITDIKLKYWATSAIYLRRFTPLMAAGINTTYAFKEKGKYAFNVDVQLNFTLLQKQKFGVHLTTGYGYRSWNLDDINYRNGQSKGVTVGLDARYSPIKNYLISCRVEGKEVGGSTFNYFILFGKLF